MAEKGSRETKDWTLMFYFASDNPLAPGIVSQLKAIKDAGYHPDANVIARFDPRAENTPAHIFDVNHVNKLKTPGEPNIGFVRDPYIRNLVADKLWTDLEIRDGIRQTLKNGHGKANDYDPPIPDEAMSSEQSPKDALMSFLEFCRQEYPAQHYVLFILGHGIAVGNDLFLFDEHAPQSSLKLSDLGIILRGFKSSVESNKSQPGKFELIGFHSCSMSGLEIAYELKDTAKYLLASQGPAYVGSWPYRQILMRIFKNLSSFSEDNFTDIDGLIYRLKSRGDGVSKHLLERFDSHTKSLVTKANGSRASKEVRDALVKAFEKNVLSDPKLCEAATSEGMELSPGTKELVGKHQQIPLKGSNLERLNRRVLAETFPDEITDMNLRTLCLKIFYYCLYNSYDFQLAGYSFDLSLCDLTKVRRIDKPINDLARALTLALEDSDPLIRQLIVLAHWESQSYWQENYTDLYDFCFRLDYLCENAHPGLQKTVVKLERLKERCGQVMDELQRGVEGDDERLILRSEFAGPAYQYSHGLSVYFPWSEPVASDLWDKEYGGYLLSKNTGWDDFLKKYFEKTRREPHSAEKDSRETVATPSSLDQELLELLQTISNSTFNTEGQLNFEKSGAEDRTDGAPAKSGAEDPAGGGCDCGSFKNFPRFTRERNKGGGTVPVSPTFFDRLK
jgi:hypothetical protein